MADEQFQLEIEQLFNKNQLIPRIKDEFREAGFDGHLESLGIPVDFGLSLLAQICLHKRAALPILVGLLRGYFMEEENPNQACADMLLVAAHNDIVDWNPVRREFIMLYDITDDVKIELEKYQYPLPMVIEPREVTDNTQTGYLTIRNSIILRNNHHNDDVCLDHINAMNKIKLSINFDVVNMIQNQWKGLDKAKDGEDREEYQKRVRAFEKYDRTSRDVMELLNIAGNEFFLTHKYDKRGRCYCQGYHVNYQGNPWNKAVIQFAHGEIVEG